MANQTKYFKTPFAESGTRAEVPNNSVGGAVGFDTGFGPDYELPQGSAGRKRIERDKYNGLHHSITKNLKQWQEHLYPTWIEDDGDGAPFSYPQGMIVNHAGQDWISNEASNQEEPGAGSKWSVYFLALFDDFGTVATLAAGKYPVGARIAVTDRDLGLFTVQSGGTADGLGILDAGGDNTAVVDNTNGVIASHYGRTTDGLQAAFNKANELKTSISITGVFSVSNILLEDHSEYEIRGSGVLVSTATGGNALEIKNCTALRGYGKVAVVGNANIVAGVKVWAGGGAVPNLRTCSLHDLPFIIVDCDLAWQFGDYSAPDNLLSEINVISGYTYNCRRVGLVIGTQAVINVTNYQSVAVAGSIGTSAPSLWEVAGGVLHINGGEVQMPTVATGSGFYVYPIDSDDFDNSYGSIYINGAPLECAAAWCTAINPLGVTGVKAESGGFRVSNSNGYAVYAGSNVVLADDFSGSVVIDDTNFFHRAGAKTTPIVSGGLSRAQCKISDLAFDSNFPQGLSKLNGVIPKYNFRQIFYAYNLAGQQFLAGQTTTLQFQTVEGGENAFYTPNYVAGIFTTPKGGLRSVSVHIEVNFIAARPSSEFTIVKNGVNTLSVAGVANKWFSNTFEIGDLNEGDTLNIALTNLDGATFSVGTTPTDRISISARTL
jgi:hypothetical protein